MDYIIITSGLKYSYTNITKILPPAGGNVPARHAVMQVTFEIDSDSVYTVS